MIKIGSKSLSTTRPEDLDAAAIEATGCNAEEVAGHLAGLPLPSFVARALLPFLDDPLSIGELSALIVADAGSTSAVRALYLEAPAKEDK